MSVKITKIEGLPLDHWQPVVPQDIVDAMEPGQWYSVQMLAKGLNVSRAAVRQRLVRAVEAGTVEVKAVRSGCQTMKVYSRKG